MIGLNQP